DQDCLVRRADGRADTDKDAGAKEARPDLGHGIGNQSTHLQCSGGSRDLIVNKVDGALVWKTLFGRESDSDRYNRALGARLELSFPNQLLHTEDGCLIDVEINVHRIQRDDGGQKRLIGKGQVAASEECATNSSGDGRGDTGEI